MEWKEGVILGIFVIGSVLLFWKIHQSTEPNLLILTIFLIAILILIFFRDKLEELSIFGNALKMKLKRSQDKTEISQERSDLTMKGFGEKDLSGVEE